MRHAVTFDFHDTLVHCDEWFQLEIRRLPGAFLAWHARQTASLIEPGSAERVEHAYRRLRLSIIQHGHELSAERCLAVVFSQTGIDIDEDLLEIGVNELMWSALDGAAAVPGAVEAVRHLTDRGTPLAVVSSAVHHPFLEWSLEKIGVREAFGAIVTSAGSGYYKSRPEIYWTALEKVGAPAAGSIHVGDSARFDVEGAKRAGMRSVWLDHGSNAIPPSEPDLRVSTLEGVGPRLVHMLNGSIA